MPLAHDLLILGASTRAAAFSALRCGLRPRCGDYFGDRDVTAVCRVDRIDPDQAAHQFTELADSLSPTPWIYTGGFENHPEWVQRVSRRHPLWGIGPESLRAVRNPVQVADVLDRHGIPCPRVRTDATALPLGARWLRKPLASGGGRGIEAVTPENDVASPSHFFQERIDGPSFSALFIAERSRTHLIGITRQLIGIDGFPFAYRGSLGPMPVAASLASRLVVLGSALASSFGLAGWFGVDYIFRDGIPWPVEINPRYTASLEIHELAARRSLLALHQRSFDPRSMTVETADGAHFRPTRVIAKWIIHAPRIMVAPEIVPEENESDTLFGVRSIADVPWPGTRFVPGEPVMTLLAEGMGLAECRSRMSQLERSWSTRLGLIGGERKLGADSARSWHEGDDDVLDL